jgi:hypothetical protein
VFLINSRYPLFCAITPFEIFRVKFQSILTFSL